MFSTYSILGHGRMIADRIRFEAYLEAIGRTVTPGCVVAEIGAGTGIFALAACRAGARRVYAIEADSIVEVARDTARLNGCASKITFIQELSSEVRLPEAADVVLLDVRGVLPDEQIGVARDARARFLRPGGTMIPAADRLWVAVVESPEEYDETVAPWAEAASALGVVDARPLAAQTWRACRFDAERLATTPRCFATIDYAAGTPEEVSADVEWTVTAARQVHGLVLWFDCTVAAGIDISNAPGASPLIYRQAFFPWPEPVRLAAGDVVTVSLRGGPGGGAFGWQWRTRIRGGASGTPRIQFDQRTTDVLIGGLPGRSMQPEIP
jgi:protein arginine N-methyltransferase 1